MSQTEILTEAEQQDLEVLEMVIAQGIAAFYEVGRALREIRDRRLYRATHRSFDDYLKGWTRRLGRRRAEQLVEAARTMEELGFEPAEVRTIGSHSPAPQPLPAPRPTSERQTRPLAGLPAEDKRRIWLDASEEAKDRPPTGRQVEEARERLEQARRQETTTIGAAQRLSPVRDERSRRLERMADHLRQLRRHLEALDDPEGLRRLELLEEWIEGMG